MFSLHFIDSYTTWDRDIMKGRIMAECMKQYDTTDAALVLNRSWNGMYLEWWIHNIGYYVTLPFIKCNKIKELNLRFKDLDLEGK